MCLDSRLAATLRFFLPARRDLHFFSLFFLIKYLCLLLVCAPTEFSFLSCQGVPSIVSVHNPRLARHNHFPACLLFGFLFHIEHVPDKMETNPVASGLKTDFKQGKFSLQITWISQFYKY